MYVIDWSKASTVYMVSVNLLCFAGQVVGTKIDLCTYTETNFHIVSIWFSHGLYSSTIPSNYILKILKKVLLCDFSTKDLTTIFITTLISSEISNEIFIQKTYPKSVLCNNFKLVMLSKRKSV